MGPLPRQGCWGAKERGLVGTSDLIRELGKSPLQEEEEANREEDDRG